MNELGICLGSVAPYYNLVLVAIVITLFVYLFKTKSKIYFQPWKFIFYAILIFVFEEILTVINDLQLITLSKLIAPLLEMIMISFFIYALLLQRDYLKK